MTNKIPQFIIDELLSEMDISFDSLTSLDTSCSTVLKKTGNDFVYPKNLEDSDLPVSRLFCEFISNHKEKDLLSCIFYLVRNLKKAYILKFETSSELSTQEKNLLQNVEKDLEFLNLSYLLKDKKPYIQIARESDEPSTHMVLN